MVSTSRINSPPISDGKTIQVEVRAEGGVLVLEIKDEEGKVKAIRYADQAFKRWIKFEKTVKDGSITMIFTPQS